jgi:CBS domain-containing protein
VREAREMLVREVMTSPAVTVRPGTSLKQAIRMLDEHQIIASGVPGVVGVSAAITR